MNILITGCAGFIGFNLANSLLKEKKIKVFGVDNLNDYYDVILKKKRLRILNKSNKFFFKKLDLKLTRNLNNYFDNNKIDFVVNFAAQAGVRHSIENPKVYFDSNLIGFFNLIEVATKHKIKHFIYASSSSVYGDNINFPTSELENTDKPLSFYAATKKCNEVIAHSYSSIYKIPTTGLRLFTVYGPYGRPDMSLFKFTKNILDTKKIELYNQGNHLRDFTFIDDVVNLILKLIFSPPKSKKIPYEVYNIASNKMIHLKSIIKKIEKETKKTAKIKKIVKQKADVYKTFADTNKIKNKMGKISITNIDKGIKLFINWYKKEYYDSK